MALALRLGKKFPALFLKYEKSGYLNLVRGVREGACSPLNESHDERNVRLGRPQSPHLTIYKPQLTALLSISHRATGIVLSGYAISLGLGSIVLPCPISHYIDVIECFELGMPLIMMGKFTLAFPFTYHYFNGIRHLLWDSGRFLNIKEVYATGYTMVLIAWAAAAGLSVI